jgi:NitT/TauT family transport system permease protein
MSSERESERQSSAAAVGVPAAEPPVDLVAHPAGERAADPTPRAMATPRADAQEGRTTLRRILVLVAFVVAFAVLWEGLKFIGGDPWRFPAIGFEHTPPFRVLQLSDRQLPHLWEIAASFFEPFQRNADYNLGNYLIDQALYTWLEAIVGFALGAVIGIALASVFVHSGLLERALVPYVVASQTIPIVALAPLIVAGLGRGLTSVVIIATYLTFFPVTIAVMRGLRSPDPRAVELMRSYAASKWDVYRKVRLPASVPYLFTALKIAAAASIVGTIIGEGPGGVPQGLGRAILNFNQQYITGPEKLWATIFVAAIVGVVSFLAVRLAEILIVNRRGLSTVKG